MKEQYNYPEISEIIYKKIDEHLTFLDLKNDSEKVWDSQVQVNKCKYIIEDLKNKEIMSKYEGWLLDEISRTIGYFEEIMKKENYMDLNFKEYLKMINSIRATIAYCAQFNLEDCEIFYNIYKSVLKKQNIKLLIDM